TYSQPAEVIEPSKRPLDNPAVLAQLFAALDATTCDPRHNARFLQMGAVSLTVITFVRVDFARLPIIAATSGMPFWSVTRWRFVPALPRSVGFLPVLSPLLGRGQTKRPHTRATSQFGRRGLTCPGARDAVSAKCLLAARLAGVANRSCRTRIP